MSVKRYGPGCCPQEPMIERANGTYVEYSEYAALKEENERLKTESHEIKLRSARTSGENAGLRIVLEKVRGDREQLKARVAELEGTYKPIAEVVNTFGDPEAFAQRDIKVIAKIDHVPFGTMLYIKEPANEGGRL